MKKVTRDKLLTYLHNIIPILVLHLFRNIPPNPKKKKISKTRVSVRGSTDCTKFMVSITTFCLKIISKMEGAPISMTIKVFSKFLKVGVRDTITLHWYKCFCLIQ
jgi:hypothetical protein